MKFVFVVDVTHVAGASMSAQVVSVFATTEIEWPSELQKLYASLAIFSFDFIEIFPPECSIAVDYDVQWMAIQFGPIGIAGVVYRKPLLDPGIMLSDDYKTLAPKQDDLWFDLARKISGVDVVVSDEADKQVFPIKAPSALSQTNATIEVAQWDRLVVALRDRLALKVKAHLGVIVCDNDAVIRRLDQCARSWVRPGSVGFFRNIS